MIRLLGILIVCFSFLLGCKKRNESYRLLSYHWIGSYRFDQEVDLANSNCIGSINPCLGYESAEIREEYFENSKVVISFLLADRLIKRVETKLNMEDYSTGQDGSLRISFRDKEGELLLEYSADGTYPLLIHTVTFPFFLNAEQDKLISTFKLSSS